MLLDGLKLPLPERAVQLEPILRFAQSPRPKPQDVRAARHRAIDDTRVLEDLEVLRHRRLRDAEPSRGLADARRARHEPLDDRPANRVREREKAAIQFGLIVHL